MTFPGHVMVKFQPAVTTDDPAGTRRRYRTSTATGKQSLGLEM